MSCAAWARRGNGERGATWWPPNRRLRKKRRLLLDAAVSRRMLQKDEGVVGRVPAGGVGDGGRGDDGEGVGCGGAVVVVVGDKRESGEGAGRDTVSQN